MPTVYRSMKREPDGLPKVGSQSRELGVRVPPDAHSDVDVDSAGMVLLNRKGMSVADHWTSLLPHLIPKRLRSIVDGASGSNQSACFRFGSGPFIAEDVG